MIGSMCQKEISLQSLWFHYPLVGNIHAHRLDLYPINNKTSTPSKKQLQMHQIQIQDSGPEFVILGLELNQSLDLTGFHFSQQ